MVEMENSSSDSPTSAPEVSPRSKSSSGEPPDASNTDAAITETTSQSHRQSNSGTNGGSSDAQVAPAGEGNDSASSTMTTRASGQLHGMQLPSVKAQKGSNLKAAASGELGMGKRKMSGRFSTRQTSDELPDVTGRQSDHTTKDATGVRRISTAGRRIFGGTNT